MKRLILCIIVLLIPLMAEASYRIYLKNGSVMRGIGYYEKTDGQIRFYYLGGQVSIPSKDVKKIEEEGMPEAPSPDSVELPPPVKGEAGVSEAPSGAPAPEPEKVLTSEGAAAIKDKIAEIDARLDEIAKLEDQQRKLKAEYEEVGLRVEVLFQKGRNAALAAGRSEAEWFSFLSPQENQWAQFNTLRKSQIETELAALEKTLKPLLEEKGEITKYKQELESQLK